MKIAAYILLSRSFTFLALALHCIGYAPLTRYVLKSTSNYTESFQIPFGQRGDIPIQDRDFDGDGLADMVVFRPSTGEWWVLLSSSGYTKHFVVKWGKAGDIPK